MVGGKVDGQILFGARGEKPKMLFGSRGKKQKNVFGAKWQLRKIVFSSQRVNFKNFSKNSVIKNNHFSSSLLQSCHVILELYFLK